MKENPKSYTRKDIARLLHVSSEQVRKNEKFWGLSDRKVKFSLNKRVIRYRAEESDAIIRRLILNL